MALSQGMKLSYQAESPSTPKTVEAKQLTVAYECKGYGLEQSLWVKDKIPYHFQSFDQKAKGPKSNVPDLKNEVDNPLTNYCAKRFLPAAPSES